jgi:flagellar basal body rod protein FlgC
MIDLVVAKRGYQANVSSFTVLQDMARASARIVEERSKT